jgi:hypothetical protein
LLGKGQISQDFLTRFWDNKQKILARAPSYSQQAGVKTAKELPPHSCPPNKKSTVKALST